MNGGLIWRAAPALLAGFAMFTQPCHATVFELPADGSTVIGADTTIAFSGSSVSFQIDGRNVPVSAHYHEYRYKLVSQDAQSVTVAVVDPSGSMKIDVFHFDDTDKDLMWLSDPAVNQAKGFELKMYFRRVR